MLSEKVKSYLIEAGFYDESDDIAYRQVLENLNIRLDSAFADFNLHTTAVTFSGRLAEIYNICWFVLNSNYNLDLAAAHEQLHISVDLLPLDSFEAGGGFFYDKKNETVFEVELGNKLLSLLAGTLKPRWNNFNDFLEWFFELE